MPPSDGPGKQVTRILTDPSLGERQRSEELLPLVYDELRKLARARMAREAPGQTIQATALVHEAFLRLVGDSGTDWNGRGHFFGAAAQAMRRILVDQARRKARLRHGGDMQRVDLDDVDVPGPMPDDDLLALDQAIQKLEQADARKGQIVQLRQFGGLTAEETAEVLGVSLSTVEREWRFIKAWLRTELDGLRGGDSPEK